MSRRKISIVTLKEYRKLIMDKELDKYEDLPVVCAKDDEGNDFDRVLCAPTHMYVEGVYNDPDCDIEEAVCVN